MALPPVLPGSTRTTESPIDRALSLALAEEREAALRWAAALVRHDPTMPTALCLCGRLLGELRRREAAREACNVAIERAIHRENLPLAVAAARELARFGADAAPALDRIAGSFSKGSPRLGAAIASAAPRPPSLPDAPPVQPLPGVLTGALLLNKATEIVHEATRLLEAETTPPRIAPVPVFSALDQPALRALCAALVPVWLAEGTQVIEQGAVGNEAYFVARGELEARRARRGETIVLGRLTDGALFGELGLLSRAPRAESVIATRPSIVLELKLGALDALAEDHPDAGAALEAHCRALMVERLAQVSEVLRVVPHADQPALMRRFEPRTFEKGERLLIQDERPPGLFLIASGEVALVQRDAQGDPLVLGTLGPGDVAGEVAVVLRRPVHADAIATHTTVTLHLPAGEILQLAQDHPAALAALYALAVHRDEETRTIIEEEDVAAAEDFVLL